MYRWSSLGYHSQTGNKHNRLSIDFNVPGWNSLPYDEIMRLYRQFVYEVGALGNCRKISGDLLDQKRDKNYQFSRMERFRLRTRWFTDSGVIGAKAFVSQFASEFHDLFQAKHLKRPRRISGIDNLFSLKRLSENK